MFEANGNGILTFGAYKVDVGYGGLTIDLEIINTTGEPHDYLILSQVKDSNGNLLARSHFDHMYLNTGERKYYRQTLTSGHINPSDKFIVEVFVGTAVGSSSKIAVFKVSTDDVPYTKVPNVSAPSNPPAKKYSQETEFQNIYSGISKQGVFQWSGESGRDYAVYILTGLLIGGLILYLIIRRRK